MSASALAHQVFEQLHDESCEVEAATYVAVPDNETARWLLPASHPEIGRTLAGWAPYRLWSRAAWAAVRAASRFGRMANIPGASVMQVSGTQSADWGLLGWRGCEPPIPVVYLGTPGPRRKAVVHLVDAASGRCKAVVKVPLTDEAKGAILHEAEVLNALDAERYELAPRLLHSDWARGIATQSYVEGQPASRKLTADCWQLLLTLQLPGESTSLAAHAAIWSREIACVEHDAAGRLLADTIHELHDNSALPTCWEHGDFTPWNIKRLPEGGCALLDWEEAQRRGLPLQDAFHFLHMQDFLFEARPTLHAAEVWSGADEWSITLEQCRKLEIAYLVGAYLKCVRRHNRERARFVMNSLTLRQRKTA